MSGFLKYLTERLNTRKNRTDGLDTFRHISIKQDLVDRFGIKEIYSVAQLLEGKLPDSDVRVEWNYIGVRKTSVKKISIRKSALGALCTLAGEPNPSILLQEAREQYLAKQRASAVPWLRDGFYRDRLQQVGRGTLPKDLQDPSFFRVIEAVATNSEACFIRAFSSKVLGDSKLFEKTYKDKVCRVIRDYHPDGHRMEDLSDYDVLRSFNLFSYNYQMEFCGPLVYSVDGHAFDMTGHKTGVMWNTNTMREVRIETVPSSVKRIITIENRANFYSVPYSDEVLYIYTHGFLSPLERKICVDIMNHCPGAEYLHWGDLDYGGVRIYLYLKNRVFPKIQPYCMDENAYDEYAGRASGYRLAASTVEKLKGLDCEELEGLKQKLLSTGIGFEQEEMLSW